MAARRNAQQPPLRRRRGRPLLHQEAWSKVSVVLMDRQVLRLDRLIDDIHKSSGRTMTRAAVIRALVDGVFDSSIDVRTIA